VVFCHHPTVTQILFVISLGYKQIDVPGFSMGGFIAQMMVLEAPPGLIRTLVLVGTAPSQEPGVDSGNAYYFQNLATATTDGDLKAAFLAGFFALNEER
jgi:pimeloyl-ACP methyl ester carboxylesterase